MVRDTIAEAHESGWALRVRAGHILGPSGSATAGDEAKQIGIFIQEVSLHEKVFFQLNVFFWYFFFKCTILK